LTDQYKKAMVNRFVFDNPSQRDREDYGVPKVGMEPIRRRQLIEATIESIHAHGFADATVSRISNAAGVSSGIVHHYFGSKGDLLEATMRWLMTDLRAQVVRRLAAAKSPRERLEAIIDGNFAPRQFSQPAVTAWIAFWAQAPGNEALARLQRINTGRLQSNLRHALRGFLPAAASARVALGLAALIDGLSVRCALSPGGLAPEVARAIARDHLAAELTAANRA
jgi:TetR/AcrR family transcriptional repressor of bet genes